MSAHRLPMHKIREVLRLHHQLSLSRRQIARSLAISRDSVATTIERATEAGLCWSDVEQLSDADLQDRLYRPLHPSPPEETASRPLPNWNWVHKELQRKHVTLRLLWEEYHQDHPDCVRYSWFCERYRLWRRHVDPVMRQEHKAGDKLFVDWAGDGVGIVDMQTGEERTTYLFVAALGCSSYTYAEATLSQQLGDWIGAHVRALEFIGGVPRLIVPDNTKTAVKRPCFYDPTLNRSYAEMATHYGTAILPTRIRSPRDKAKVEAAVLHAQRRILARLRNRTFFSLAALNEAISEELDVLNAEPFQKLEGSRRTRFETLDVPALQPLPAQRYDIGEWKTCRAGVDYHVEVDRHFYSVPYQLIRCKLDVRYTDATVEVFYDGDRVASHVRSARLYGYTTVAEHMPSSHRRYGEWSPGRILRWAASIGEATSQVCSEILRTRPHPEHGFRGCMGVLRLSKQYGPERLEAACRRAIEIGPGAMRYRSIRSILKRRLDQASLFEHQAHAPLPEHEHIRGPEYYN